MKISQIGLFHLRMRLSSPFETSFGRIEERECILVEVRSGGLEGYGECVADRDPGYSYETTGTAWHILRDFLAPALLKCDIDSLQDYYKVVTPVRGHPMAKAGLEMALWDLLGKSRGLALKDMLGGVRQKVEVGVSVGVHPTLDSLLDSVAAYLERGYRRVKLKIKPGQDVQETAAVRQNYPELRLQVDANAAYHLETAQVLLPLDDLGLLMIEQPLAEDDLWDHSKLQKRFSTPVCLDESIQSLRHVQQALEMDACRIINIKAGRVGGLSQAVAIHDYCYERGAPVWCGGMLETGVGRAANLSLASLPGFTLPGDISASDRYYLEDITNERFSLNPESTITVPTGAGLGVTIDHRALENAALNRVSIS